jgi:small subunit ribosomal protein S16
MLVIRMQRTGRKGHAMFRVIVQDSRRTPTSGKIVAALGSYDPHSKQVILDKDKAGFYLEHGAQPSDRVARLLKAEGVKLPGWVKLAGDKERTVRNADKRRSTRPAEPEAPAEETTAPVEEVPAEPASEVEASEEVAVDEAAVEAVETAETEAPAEAIADETPAAETEAPEAAAETETEASAAESEAEESEPAEKQ